MALRRPHKYTDKDRRSIPQPRTQASAYKLYDTTIISRKHTHQTSVVSPADSPDARGSPTTSTRWRANWEPRNHRLALERMVLEVKDRSADRFKVVPLLLTYYSRSLLDSPM